MSDDDPMKKYTNFHPFKFKTKEQLDKLNKNPMSDQKPEKYKGQDLQRGNVGYSPPTGRRFIAGDLRILPGGEVIKEYEDATPGSVMYTKRINQTNNPTPYALANSHREIINASGNLLTTHYQADGTPRLVTECGPEDRPKKSSEKKD